MSKAFNSIWSTDGWPFALEWLPQPAYLVGGAVRDGLLGRKADYLDLDFVVFERAIETARNIAKYYKAGFVLLDADRQICRVVFEDATVDFAQAEGDSLDRDLRRRDFTLNAIAYNPFTRELTDPHGGQTDLRNRVIRMISPQNLRDDPLRLLRGYRQAAQLGCQIEPQTRAAICELAPLLSRVAVERVQAELGYLLNATDGGVWIADAWENGLLSPFFPNARGQFDRLLNINGAADTLGEQFPALTSQLSDPLRDTLKISLLAIAKLACLLTPDPEIAELELTELKYSKAETRSAIALIRGLSSLLQTPPGQWSRRWQYFLFQEVGNLFPALAVLGVASGLSAASQSALIERFLDSDDPVAHPRALVTGKELMAALNLSPSPKIGQLLMKIQLAQAEGQISTPSQALEWAARSLENGG